jgi:hypothetical protein
LRKAEELDDRRQGRDQRQREQPEHDAAERQGQRGRIELDDAALLLLVVDDVETGHQRLHRGRGAPQREQQREDHAESEALPRLAGDLGKLVGDDRARFLGDEPDHDGDLLLDVMRVERQAIDRDRGGQCGKERQQAVEAESRGEDREVVLRYLVLHPHENVPPAPRRDFGRRVGTAAAPALARAVMVDGTGLSAVLARGHPRLALRTCTMPMLIGGCRPCAEGRGDRDACGRRKDKSG